MNSQELFEESKKIIPGGVSSPVRAFKPYPFFVAKGEGSHIYDVDGNSYIDHCLAYGPLILGHADKDITSGVYTHKDLHQLKKAMDLIVFKY